MQSSNNFQRSVLLKNGKIPPPQATAAQPSAAAGAGAFPMPPVTYNPADPANIARTPTESSNNFAASLARDRAVNDLQKMQAPSVAASRAADIHLAAQQGHPTAIKNASKYPMPNGTTAAQPQPAAAAAGAQPNRYMPPMPTQVRTGPAGAAQAGRNARAASTEEVEANAAALATGQANEHRGVMKATLPDGTQIIRMADRAVEMGPNERAQLQQNRAERVALASESRTNPRLTATQFRRQGAVEVAAQERQALATDLTLSADERANALAEAEVQGVQSGLQDAKTLAAKKRSLATELQRYRTAETTQQDREAAREAKAKQPGRFDRALYDSLIEAEDMERAEAYRNQFFRGDERQAAGGDEAASPIEGPAAPASAVTPTPPDYYCRCCCCCRRR